MAINFYTGDPASLLKTFKKAIDDGHVATWSYDSDGDLTHTPDQWRHKGWLRPTVVAGRLVMSFLGNKSQKTSKEVYAVYHGRFVESMLAHCDALFDNASSTAMPVTGDQITSAAA